MVDSEVIASILSKAGMTVVESIGSADFVLLNSCSVREDGHDAVRCFISKIEEDHGLSKRVIITGCFATQLDKCSAKELGHSVSAVITPGQYELLPAVLRQIKDNPDSLIMVGGDDSVCELYENHLPSRLFEDKTTAAVTIAKGCNQKCTYCIEPITRGEEHCKSPEAIFREVEDICRNGYRELTLVGHCVDKYQWSNADGAVIGFAELLDSIAERFPKIRIKFLSSHPTFYSDEILTTVCRHNNIMKVVHLPVQSGSDSVLHRMGRGYDVAHFEKRVAEIRRMCPDMAIITDIMVGFCGETDADFEQTYQLVERMGFNDINVFKYSMRPGTAAHKLFTDDVPEDVKEERFQAIIALRDQIKESLNQAKVGQTVKIIIEKVNEIMEIQQTPWLTLNIYRIYGRDQYNNNVWYEVRTNAQFGLSEDELVNTVEEVPIFRATKNELIGYEFEC